MLFSSLHILRRKRKPLLCGMIKSALRKAIRPDGTRFYTTEQHAVAAVPHGSFLLTAAPPRGFEPPETVVQLYVASSLSPVSTAS